MLARLVLLLTTLTAFSAQAEYRAYLLTVNNPKTGREFKYVTTLDDIQFPMYYPLNQYDEIVLTDTWMCWGRMGEGVPTCPNPHPDAPFNRPRAQASKAGPVSRAPASK